ncbi:MULTISPECIES: hypothetical protein [Actinomycetes]|uniref:Uncharacterized protein n=3 Tax=Actinomycetes TaxID=1760 RepID=A0A7W3NS28_STRMR|nr:MULTISPECIES: hypothetical protein [Streptomyces]MYQ99923.1 hypothetical protein [Streptomyces sp. SID6139]MYR21824.1 hypothetical protein [Streptomyces sp. SID6137]MBA9055645.1 hypothetical protein [Streptomyces murinus]MCE3029896.1 hypothetical protein [Streptomyces sp. CMSTAAHL-2]TGZ15912.1 hypothetical protein DV517_08850 [Streptomyces sp. S816]
MGEITNNELLRVDAIVESLEGLDATEYGTEALSAPQAASSDVPNWM